MLGQRALNHALLERQMLLRRVTLTAAETIEHLVGLQAQAPRPPYLGLWTRLDGFSPDHLAQLIAARRAVRIALMRSTIHLVSARDCLKLRTLVQPVLDRSLQGSYGRHLAGLDLQAVAAAGRALLEQRPRTAHELGNELFDLPDAPRPDPDIPAPPRFLPAYDNALLSHADRTRIISDEHRKRIAASRLEVGTCSSTGS